MKVRKIQFRAKDSNDYVMYIDIGSCEKHYDFLPLYDDSITSYKHWYEDFLLKKMGVQMLTLHYYLLEFKSNGYLPDDLKIRISEHLALFNDFNQEWFAPDTPSFNYLDLNWEDIEEEILISYENYEGIKTEIEFHDGSKVRFLNDDDTIQSFYVPEWLYPELENDVNLILEKLK